MPRISLKTKRQNAYASYKGVIRDAMEKHYMSTQLELCKKTGLARSTLNRHLKDMDSMKLGELMTICDTLGIKMSLEI